MKLNAFSYVVELHMKTILTGIQSYKTKKNIAYNTLLVNLTQGRHGADHFFISPIQNYIKSESAIKENNTEQISKKYKNLPQKIMFFSPFRQYAFHKSLIFLEKALVRCYIKQTFWDLVRKQISHTNGALSAETANLVIF